MSSEKEISYRELPFSEETPEDRFHSFLTIQEVISKVTKHQRHAYECQTIGVVSFVQGCYAMQDLNNSHATMRLSIEYLRVSIPTTSIPYTARLYGFVHWNPNFGPVIYAELLIEIPSSIAQTIQSALQTVSTTMCLTYPEEVEAEH